MKLVIGLTDAPGVAYGLELQAYLAKCAEVETYTVIAEGARQRILTEMRWTPCMVDALIEDERKRSGGTGDPRASDVDGVILAPCSVERLAATINAGGEDWLSQTVDACMRQRRPVIALVTQTRLEPEHLELMLRVSRMGASLLCAPDCHACEKTLSVMSSEAIAEALELVGVEPLGLG